jgi:putative phosphoribosyl transferase
MAVPFLDRAEAGRLLATRLTKYANRSDVQVLALPRGGVPVAFEVAKALNAPLDVFTVRKLGVPGHEELAMGAIASGGVRILNSDIVDGMGIPRAVIESVTRRELQELARREREFRDDRPQPDLQSLIVILVDDGLATGATMRAAVTAVRKQQPAKIVVAVPAAARPVCDEFQTEVDEFICAETPQPFYAVGAAYEHFPQITDEQVREMLERQTAPHPS